MNKNNEIVGLCIGQSIISVFHRQSGNFHAEITLDRVIKRLKNTPKMKRKKKKREKEIQAEKTNILTRTQGRFS